MPSTYSPNLRLELQATGENRTTWGTKANNDFTLIEAAIAGYSAVAMANADVTLTAVNGATDQSRLAMLNFTGANTAIRTVTIPSVSKVYIVKNSTTGGFAINIKTSAGSTLVLPTGATRTIWCDGSSTFFTEVAIGVAEGGTGATTAAGARTALGTDNASNLTSGTVADARLPTTMDTKTFSGNTTLSVGSQLFHYGGAIELGRQDGVAQGSAYIDFHTSATAVDYNVRLLASGTTGTLGSGDLAINAATVKRSGNTMWDAGNDGAGSGLDADLLDGMQPTTGGSATTIVQRGSDGSIRGSVFMADGAANSSTIYIGSNGTHYLQYDGANYVIAAGSVYIDNGYNLSFRGGIARLQSDGNLFFDGGMLSNWGADLNGALSAKAGVYTGTGTGDTVFPIGHSVMANNMGSIQRNQSGGLWINAGNSTQYVGSASGTQLSGTWRQRGNDNSNGTLMQRTA